MMLEWLAVLFINSRDRSLQPLAATRETYKP